MSLNTYLSLCTEAYELSKPNPPQDAYKFYKDYVRNTKGPILEPMCGTGRFLLPLLQEGYEIHGFDASECMLACLKNKAKKEGIKPYVWKEFLENLSRSEHYNLIFIPSGSFCLITDPKTTKIALKTVYDHLTKDGIFLFEIDTLATIPQIGIWYGSKWMRADGNMIILSQCSDFQDNVCSTICKYELIKENQIIHTEIENLNIRIYEEKELTTILQEIGFSEVRIIKTFDKNFKPNETDETIVYECRK